MSNGLVAARLVPAYLPGAQVSAPYYQKVLSTRPGALVAYWPLWETSGAMARDLKGRIAGDAVVNGLFTTDTTGWSATDATLSSVAGGISGNCLHVANAGANYGSARQAVVTIPGVTYDLYYSHKNDDVSGYVLLGTSSGGNQIFDSGTINDANWTTRRIGFTARTTSTYIRLSPNSGTDAQATLFDSISMPTPLHGLYTGVNLGRQGIGDGRTSPYFDGANDYVNIHSAALASLFNGAEGTLAIWAKVNNSGVWTDGGGHIAVQLKSDADNIIYIYKPLASKILSILYCANGVTSEIRLTNAQYMGYHHYAITWSKSRDEVRAYVDGAQVGATVTGLGVWAGSLSSTLTMIGAQNNVPLAVWNGNLAHCALWNMALSPYEIRRLSEVA